MANIRLALGTLTCFVPQIVGELPTLPAAYRALHAFGKPEGHRLTKVFRKSQQTFRHVADISRNLATLWVLHFDPVKWMGGRHDEFLMTKLSRFIYHESLREPRSVWLRFIRYYAK